MRLTAMESDKALAALCDLVDPASAILEDKKTADAFALCAKALEKPMPVMVQCLVVAKAFAPVIKAHQEECISAAAVLLGKTCDEVRKQRLTKTITELRAVWDEDLRDFFTSSVDMAGEK